jgi:hypothetical protein
MYPFLSFKQRGNKKAGTPFQLKLRVSPNALDLKFKVKEQRKRDTLLIGRKGVPRLAKRVSLEDEVDEFFGNYDEVFDGLALKPGF